jgi:hypothetical protein
LNFEKKAAVFCIKMKNRQKSVSESSSQEN